MGRTRMPSFCLNRIRPHVQIRSPPIQAKGINENFSKKVEDDDHEEKTYTSSTIAEDKNAGDIPKPTPVIGRKIMILVDSSLEAKNALQWALTHTVQSHDLLVLLYVTKPSSKQDEDSKKEINPRIFEFLASMKNTCKLKRPEVQVEVAVAQGKEKGPLIVDEAKKQEVSLLVLGQKKRSMTWRLMMMWAGRRVVVSGGGSNGGGEVVEYCIQNASCMAIAVRRKSKKLGGYLITTKRQKDFWLLA